MKLETLTAISTIAAALGTLAAAIFVAISAWYTRISAKAAKDAVEETRKARRLEVAPKLILEKDFLDFIFIWPHPDSLNGEAVFLSRRHWKDKKPVPPTFSLKNCGQSPALEVTIVFELDDPNDEFFLPKNYQDLGLSLQNRPSTDHGTIATLTYMEPGSNRGSGLPLYRKWTTDIPNCLPNQIRTVEFPVHLLNTLFLRGLQLGGIYKDNSDITLSARISCYATDFSKEETQFRWKIYPFTHGSVNPVEVYGHCYELPMYPKPIGPRVA